MRKEVFQMDEKKEKKSMKNNLEYFWMYYKLPFIAGMIVVILAMYFLITTLTTKDTALSVMLIDCHTEMSGEEMAEEYMDTAGIDKKKQQVQIQMDVLDDVLFVLPFGLALRQCVLSVGDFLAQMFKAFAADLVRLLHKRLLLDLHLGELALRQIDLFGHAVDLDAQTAGCLVHEVDGLVGQETIGDVAVR